VFLVCPTIIFFSKMGDDIMKPDIKTHPLHHPNFKKRFLKFFVFLFSVRIKKIPNDILIFKENLRKGTL